MSSSFTNSLTLSLNCGSSSLKFSIFQTQDLKLLARGVVNGIGGKGSLLMKLETVESGKKDKVVSFGVLMTFDRPITFSFPD
jgi:acetate kinase